MNWAPRSCRRLIGRPHKAPRNSSLIPLAASRCRQARRRLSISSETVPSFRPANGETFKQELWSRNGFGQARRARFTSDHQAPHPPHGPRPSSPSAHSPPGPPPAPRRASPALRCASGFRADVVVSTCACWPASIWASSPQANSMSSSPKSSINTPSISRFTHLRTARVLFLGHLLLRLAGRAVGLVDEGLMRDAKRIANDARQPFVEHALSSGSFV